MELKPTQEKLMMNKMLLLSSALLLSVALVGCSSPAKDIPREDPRAKQERQDRTQRDHRSASERLDREVR